MAGFKYFDLPKGMVALELVVRGHNGKDAKGTVVIADNIDFMNPIMTDITVKMESILCMDFPSTGGTRALYLSYRGKGSLDLMTLKFQ